MADAKRDNNYIPTMIALDSSDGTTITLLTADINNNNGLCVSNGTSGSDNGGDHALRDNNNIPTMIAVSSVDGVTPVAIYTSSNEILIKTT